MNEEEDLEEGDSFGGQLIVNHDTSAINLDPSLGFSVDDEPIKPSKPAAKPSSQVSRPMKSSKSRPTDHGDAEEVDVTEDRSGSDLKSGQVETRLIAVSWRVA